MKIAVCILGFSRSGKDTVQGILQARIPQLQAYKFSAPMKRTLEYLYSLPDGALEEDTFRNAPVSSITGHPDDRTFTDLMVDSFHHFRTLDPRIMLHKAEKELAEKPLVSFTDLRTSEEADLVSQADALFLIRVFSPFQVARASDHQLKANLAKLQQKAKAFYHVANSGTVTDLEQSEVLELITHDINDQYQALSQASSLWNPRSHCRGR